MVNAISHFSLLFYFLTKVNTFPDFIGDKMACLVVWNDNKITHRFGTYSEFLSSLQTKNSVAFSAAKIKNSAAYWDSYSFNDEIIVLPMRGRPRGHSIKECGF